MITRGCSCRDVYWFRTNERELPHRMRRRGAAWLRASQRSIRTASLVPQSNEPKRDDGRH
jgi:hypothetical protein